MHIFHDIVLRKYLNQKAELLGYAGCYLIPRPEVKTAS
jgi:hypothetical protein